MPLGFDEFRAIELENWISDEADVPNVPFASINFPYELFLRSRDSGAWQWFEGITNYAKDERGRNSVTGYHAHFVDPLDAHNFTRVDKWLSRLKELASIPDPNSHFFIPPGLWTPKIQLEQKIGLTTAIPNVLQAIATQRKSLAEIPWRDLEEIVAELLRASGLEVFLTKRSRDGGRDIIARGELYPANPLSSLWRSSRNLQLEFTTFSVR